MCIRDRLYTDDKILTAWNALAIVALCRAARVFEDMRYAEAAEKAIQFLQTALKNRTGGLSVRWREGEAAYTGQLSDYAFMAWAFLEHYRFTLDLKDLEEACRLARQMLVRFRDEKSGGFYLYAKDAEQLIRRPKEVYDGALPSGNAVAALVFIRLAAITGQAEWNRERDRQLAFLAGMVAEQPLGHGMALAAMLEAFFPEDTLVCAMESLSDSDLALLSRQEMCIRDRRRPGHHRRTIPARL